MKKKRIKSQHCSNCGYDFKIDPKHNNFCPNCGQENHNPRLPILHYLYELFENLTHFDNRIWHTLKALIFKPGSVTKDFIHNKRQRYTPPPRLFIFSLAVFILFFEAAQDTMVKHDAPQMEMLSLKEQMQRLPDTALIAFSKPFFTGEKVYYTVAQLKDLQQNGHHKIGQWLERNGMRSWLVYRMQAKMVLHNMASALPVKDYNRHIVRIHYQVLIIMMFISALLIYLLFYYRGRMLYDTLVMSVHLYVFGFLAGIVVAVAVLMLIRVNVLKDTTIMLPIVMLISVTLNFIPAYKRVFERSWPSTIARGLVVGGLNVTCQILLFWVIAGLRG